MFSWLRKRVSDPPTQRQLNYASQLGIHVTPKMTKTDLSALISRAEKANPKLARQRENINRKRSAKAEKDWADECGQELLAAEASWIQFAEQTRFILAIYDRGKETIVDVLDVHDAQINGKRKKMLKLMVSAPKLVKDKHIGDYLVWEREFTLPIEKLIHYESLQPNFDSFDLNVYQQTVKRGLKLAKRINKKRKC